MIGKENNAYGRGSRMRQEQSKKHHKKDKRNEKDRELRTLQEETKQLSVENECVQINKPVSMGDDSGGPAGFYGSEIQFLEIIKKEEAQFKDRVIWKAYSKHGGVYDTLKDIENAIEHPSANAFSFDEKEGHYVIFITLYNTYIKRMKQLCNEMSDACRKGQESGGQELWTERKELQERCGELLERYTKLQEQHNSLQEQYNKVQKVCNRMIAAPMLVPVSGGSKEKVIEQLKIEKARLSSQQLKVEEYNREVENYNKRFEEFTEKCNIQKTYTPKYMALYELLKQLGEVQNDGNVFHALTKSPAQEEGLDGYLEAARAFCRQISYIRNKYPL